SIPAASKRSLIRRVSASLTLRARRTGTTKRTEDAERAIAEMRSRYPVPRTELEPRVFMRVTDNWVELSARFVVPVRRARSVKDALTRRISERFEAAGIEFASETLDVTIRGTPR
ncbi:MAG TPA: hypothetical protein VNT23_08505, partial [Gaiellaceae bacterium]|nr:hypothetical protein [Gaiellaceae bacterium]